ncbi:MAG TPA: DUF2341 domain-containing protein [Myxococcota bacterium]|nr:DUF2341 domain-containing protein [Myxococcota bacterium]
MKKILAALLVLGCTACSSSTSGPDRPPLAVAGPDQVVRIRQTAVLDGSASYDPDADEIDNYRWTLLASPSRAKTGIEGDDGAVASLTPDRSGVWLLRLEVEAGGAWSEPDVMRVQSMGGPCQSDADCAPCRRCDETHECIDDLGRNDDCLACYQCAPGGSCRPQDAGGDIKGNCDNGFYCDGPESCDGSGACQNGIAPCQAPLTCDEGLDKCTGCSSGDECPACQECAAASQTCEPQGTGSDKKNDCDDGLPCRTGACDGNSACGTQAQGSDCDDATYCNGADVCDTAGVCTHAGSPCPETECNHCQEASQGCHDPQGVPCIAQGADCISGASCDGVGDCLGTPDNSYCTSNQLGELCIPQCSADASGCVTPPDSLYLVCDNPVLLPDDSGCTITLAGGDTISQADCLDCSAEIGPVLVDSTDFGDELGRCDLGGWRLLPGWWDGNHCLDSVFKGGVCGEADGAKDCCDDLDKICSDSNQGAFTLFHDKVTDCGTKHEEWRLEKTFDLTGLGGARVCFDTACRGADQNDGIIVVAEDESNYQQIYCATGGKPDDFFWHACTRPIDAWADGNPAVTIRLIVHSEADNHAVYLDNVSVHAFGAGCRPTPSPLLDDGFSNAGSCDTSAWSFVGDAHGCPGSPCAARPEWSPAVEANGSSFSMSTSVDASDLDGQVSVCFGVGSTGTNVSSYLALSYNTGAGVNEAFRLTGGLGVDGQCREFCVNLSDLDPGVNNAPLLGLEFVLHSPIGKIDIYYVKVQGIEFCPAGGSVSLDVPVGDGLGNYDFTAADTSGGPLAARLSCVWSPQSLPADQREVDFRKPRAAWLYRRKIVFNNGSQGEDLSAFPVLVRLHSSWFNYNNTKDFGEDIRFVDADLATDLPYEIEKWDESGSSVIWVRVPHIPGGSTDDYIWMYYGNDSATDDQNRPGVWDTGFLGVYHLAEPDWVRDSSWRGRDGWFNGLPSTMQTGGFGDFAVSFDGDDDRAEVGNWDVVGGNGDNGITLEAFAWRDAGSLDGRLISKADGQQDGNHWWMLSTIDSGSRLRFRLKLGGVTQILLGNNVNYPDEQWVYSVASYDGTTMRLYFNGSPDGEAAHGGTISTDGGKPIWIGSNPWDHYDTWDGLIGEVRVSNTARSPGWIRAQQRSLTGSFATIELELPN